MRVVVPALYAAWLSLAFLNLFHVLLSSIEDDNSEIWDLADISFVCPTFEQPRPLNSKSRLCSSYRAVSRPCSCSRTQELTCNCESRANADNFFGESRERAVAPPSRARAPRLNLFVLRNQKSRFAVVKKRRRRLTIAQWPERRVRSLLAAIGLQTAATATAAAAAAAA